MSGNALRISHLVSAFHLVLERADSPDLLRGLDSLLTEAGKLFVSYSLRKEADSCDILKVFESTVKASLSPGACWMLFEH